MVYYNRFGENYNQEMARIEERRESLINAAQLKQPDNIEGLLADSEDGKPFDLQWVEVPSPHDPASIVSVRPTIMCGKGLEDAEREKDRFDRGVYQLILEGRLLSGDTRLIGDVTFFHTDHQLKYEPTITVNMANENYGSTYVRWDSADAELFLSLAESALAAQPE